MEKLLSILKGKRVAFKIPLTNFQFYFSCIESTKKWDGGSKSRSIFIDFWRKKFLHTAIIRILLLYIAVERTEEIDWEVGSRIQTILLHGRG